MNRLVFESVASPHVYEILPGPIRWPKIGHASFVYDAHLIKELEERLSGLVEGHNSGKLGYVCCDAQCAYKLESSARV